MYLFFDTETTGLPKNWKAPVTDVENWPRIVQIAWIMCDSKGTELERRSYIVRPEGFSIPADAARVHGITTERALREGVVLSEVCGEFREYLDKTEYLVGHNIQFDEKVLGAEFVRMGVQSRLGDIPTICTMRGGTDFCAIPGPYGYKWPKLLELHEALFGESFTEAHDASVDIGATARCFWELRGRGIL